MGCIKLISVQANRKNFIKDPDYYFASAGANYWLKDNLTFALIYAHQWNANKADSEFIYTNENRITQQVQYVSKLGNVSVQQRFRIDERWQQKFENGEKTDVYAYSTRLRYFFGVHIPVFKNPMLPGLLVNDEVLIQFENQLCIIPFLKTGLISV